MKTRIAVFGLTLITGLGITIYSGAAGSHLVEGDLLKIDGEFYTVHDTAGHEVRLHVDKATLLEGTFKVGDRIEVYATDNGHARAVYHITHLQPAP
jgi:hypothetical protein